MAPRPHAHAQKGFKPPPIGCVEPRDPGFHRAHLAAHIAPQAVDQDRQEVKGVLQVGVGGIVRIGQPPDREGPFRHKRIVRRVGLQARRGALTADHAAQGVRRQNIIHPRPIVLRPHGRAHAGPEQAVAHLAAGALKDCVHQGEGNWRRRIKLGQVEPILDKERPSAPLARDQ